MVDKIITKYDRQVTRFLEILPGAFSWGVILFLFLGSLWLPHYVAYLIILFDIYWFYKSANVGITSIISHLKIRASMAYNWLADVQALPDWQKIHHIIIIPNYQEPFHVLERTIQSLAAQDLPAKKHLTLVLAMEKREIDAEKKAQALMAKFQKDFAHIFYTLHPDLPNEVKGKSSNQAWAAKWVKRKMVDELGYDMNYLTVTSCDADSIFHPKYFAALTYSFLTEKERFRRFWHAALWYYTNIWQVPAPIRVLATFHSVWRTSILIRRDLLIHTSVYSLSLKMLDEVGYWDTDVIPEDYRIFFKCFFNLEGKIDVEPIFLPIFVQSPQSSTYWRTLRAQYEQMKRWAWGVSDDPLIIKWWFTKKNVPFGLKTMHLINLLLDHFLWPVNWFILTLGANIPVLLNPVFAQTVMGQNLPKMSFAIITATTIFLIAILWVDFRQRPPTTSKVNFIRKIIMPAEFLLMPLVGFFFSALPGLDAHTRLMLGKYIEYKVTEKG